MPEPDIAHIQAKKDDDDGHGSFFPVYQGHSKTLRNWLILYGAGLPACFLKEEAFAKLLKESGKGEWIIGLFLAAILLQVMQVFVYKIMMGYHYLHEEKRGTAKEEFAKTKRYTFSDWYCSQYGLVPQPRAATSANRECHSGCPADIECLTCLGSGTLSVSKRRSLFSRRSQRSISWRHSHNIHHRKLAVSGQL
ncbi:MAG: hypothetical protein KDK99_07920 [Verrucomicrobiales bacterium]|nr:hypothetical protein [Verrucomicrobiales bacterium]